MLRPTRPQSRAEQLAERRDEASDGFLREVDAALREDETLAVLHRVGKPVVALVAGGLAILGGWLWWQNHQTGIANQRAEVFIQALDKVDAGNLTQAAGMIQPLAASGGNGSQAAARLMEAGIAEQQGHGDQAETIYQQIIADSTTPAPYRDLATIRDVALRFDSMTTDAVVAKLRPLAVPGAPWFGSAGELLGFAYLKQGRKDLAAPLFGTIARDSTVPDSLRARARQMGGLLGNDVVPTITTMEAPSPPTPPSPPSAP